MPFAEPVAELVAVLVGLAVAELVELVAVAQVGLVMVASAVLAAAALVPVVLAAALESVVLAAAALEPRLHTYSALFVAASPHLEPGIVNLHSPFLRLDPSPSPLLPPSFDCR